MFCQPAVRVDAPARQPVYLYTASPSGLPAACRDCHRGMICRSSVKRAARGDFAGVRKGSVQPCRRCAGDQSYAVDSAIRR